MLFRSTILNDTTVSNIEDICKLSLKLYEKAYSALDILYYIEVNDVNNIDKYRVLLTFNKIRKEFRNEKLLNFFILNYIYFRNIDDLENISFM